MTRSLLVPLLCCATIFPGLARGEVTGGAAQGGIGILIAGPEVGRTKMEETLRPLLGAGADVHWSTSDRLPIEEGLPTAKTDGTSQIWIDMANPIQIRVYLPAKEADGSTTVRTVTKPAGDDSDLLGRETVAQIVKAAVLALRGEGPPADGPRPEPAAAMAAPPPPATAVAAAPAFEGGAASVLHRYSVVISAGAHNAPFNLSEPPSESNWLGPAVLGSVRYQTQAYLLALRLSWETSDRSVDMYYLKNTYLAGTVGGYRVFDSGLASFAVGLEAGVLVLHQNVWLDGPWQVQNGWSSESMLPGQTGKSNSTGALFGPVAEFNIAPTPRLFLHLEAGIPVALLETRDESGNHWGGSWYYRLLLGVGFRL